ncbi:MGLL [Symbiodinium sp. CCMP2456]|nr:MGLL [Symbiodinium sp. CCMP2456]
MGAYAILAAIRMAWILRGRRQTSSCAKGSGSGQSSEDCEAGCQGSCKGGWQHLVCVPIYKESDEMVLATVTRLNLSAAAPRMRVVFAMEEATDRTEERFELYKRCLSNVPEVCFYVHPAGASKGEIRGLCSNLAYALSQDVTALLQRGNGSLGAISKYVLTKLDSQVHLPPNYFEELELSCQQMASTTSEAVVWQPLPVSLLNRELSYGPSRALTSMRTFCYPTLFGLDVMVVTCYSLPLLQYVKMGYHHPGYMGEDMMMLAQAAVCHRRARVVMLPVLVAVAPPIDSTLCGSMMEANRQGVRWAGQTAEVAEFSWRFRARGTSCRSLWGLLKYWLVRIALVNGLGLFSLSLAVSTAAFATSFPHDQALLLQILDKLLQLVIVLLLFVIPLYEQYLSSLFPDPSLRAPLVQLPWTILWGPVALLTNVVVDLWAWYKFLVLGKAAIVLTHRKKHQVSPQKVVEPS